jgi:hypothetical protein
MSADGSVTPKQRDHTSECNVAMNYHGTLTKVSEKYEILNNKINKSDS